MKMNKEGIALVKRFEGFRANAYQDSAGVWTIGYGHTSKAGDPIVAPGMTISREEGEQILQRDLDEFEDYVRDYVKVDLNDNQFSALVSFCYNVGPGNFKKSTALKRVNAEQFEGVPEALSWWKKAGGRTLRGLVRRRAAEGELFMRPVEKGAEESNVMPDKEGRDWRAIIGAVLGALAGVVGSWLGFGG